LGQNDPEAEERTRLADVQGRLAGAMRSIDGRKMVKDIRLSACVLFGCSTSSTGRSDFL